LDHAVQNKFKKQDDNTTLFEISSGTVEMRNNKLILLAD
jgi:F-type H+-transporting ATPase subunit epsilon